MINERKKLFLFDIDGTLFDNDQKKVHDSTKQALIELRKTAHVGIATGRAEFMLYSIADLLDLFDDFVLINGQYIKSNGSVVYKNTIDPDELDLLCKKMDELDIAYGFQGSSDEAISKIDERVLESFDKLGLDLPPLDKDYYFKNEVYQAWAFSNKDQVEILKQQSSYFQFIKWLDVGYDILPKSANKGNGVKKLADYLGIDMKDVIVFGDGDNDFEMIKNAGLGIAMGNATKKVKEVADFVTTSVGDDGISYALKHFGFIK
ncbi:MAG: Cof-type HAD-IIB family hydrolase [Bacilli bacterium]|nr:Cof-type HAD-IIB family hydrolase [Bacilli bacterium]